MVTDEDKPVCVAEWAETDRESNLGGFIDDAVIEPSLVEDEAFVRNDDQGVLLIDAQTCRSDYQRSCV